MVTPTQIWESINAFIEMGGDVLIVIFGVTMLMWALMLERIWYLNITHRRYVQSILEQWKDKIHGNGWRERKIRRMLISEVTHKLNFSIPTIKTLIAVCPLLGLLGTVSGMIEVFDVLAIAGSGNPRAMASGVSKATIPTMAGMVAALSGMYLIVQLQRNAEKQKSQFTDMIIGE